MRGFRYGRWDGTQDPIGDDLGVEGIVDELSEDILGGLDLDSAFRRMMRRGMPGTFGGMQSLLERLRRAREQERGRGRLDGWLEQVQERLERIIEAERAELSRRGDDESRVKESYLESLPETPAGRIAELKNYDFSSARAREDFTRLLDELRREMMSAYGEQLVRGLRQMSPDQLARLKEMLGDLNRLLDQHRAGTGPTPDEFREFMRRYGDFFPENPQDIRELIEALARRSVALSRLLASLSAEQRAELQKLSDEILGDLDLAFELSQLTQSMRDLFPDMQWDVPVPMDGDEPLGLREGLEAIERMRDFDELERALKSEHPGAALEDVDVDRLRRALGDDAVGDLERLKRIERALEEAGIMTRRGGRLELTPRGIRKIGERALARIFERLAVARPGAHDAHTAGATGEPTGTTRRWTWGDPFQIDVRRTIHNAVIREGSSDGRVRLRPDDFELAEAETRTSVATVLLLDMSFSMPMRGNWIPAKRMALALHSLIASKYPEDEFFIVGFSDYARLLRPDDLVQAGWEHVYGTNMQHAFHLAGRLLGKHPRATKQVLLVTDGEPTAHLVGEEVFFHWPPVRETLEKTYKEALRLAKAGVTMNIFMLEDTPALFGFVDRLARVINGRVFAVRGEDLGDFAVRDYLRGRPSR